MWRRLETLLILLVAGAATAATHADSGLLNDALGRWLDTEAAPALAEKLANHPRFKGETLRVVSMRDGRPLDSASQLHRAVEKHLTQRLLRYPGVRIAWEEEARTPCGAPQPVAYLLGVEIERDGSREHKANIAMIDVSEAVWVSGVNESWQGRLTTAERIALNKSLDTLPRGTIDSPLPVTDSARIAALLQQHMLCALPDGLDGPLYLEPPDAGAVAEIGGELRNRLSIAPLAAITPRRDGASWVLSIDTADSGSRTQQLQLLLEDGARNVTQQVAAVYVTGLESPSSRAPTRTIADVRGAVDEPLLSAMRIEDAEDRGICDRSRARVNTCVEVSFELYEPAYLFVLSTNAHRLTALSCTRSAARSDAGERRYRVRVPPDSVPSRATAGIYAIAVNDRALAEKLAVHMIEIPGGCGERGGERGGERDRPGTAMRGWLAELDTLIARHPDSFDWRVAQLAHKPEGVVRL